jgi:hypothetical protein
LIIAKTVGDGFSDIVVRISTVPHDLYLHQLGHVHDWLRLAHSWEHICQVSLATKMVDHAADSPDVYTGSSQSGCSFYQSDLGAIRCSPSLRWSADFWCTLT